MAFEASTAETAECIKTTVTQEYGEKIKISEPNTNVDFLVKITGCSVIDDETLEVFLTELKTSNLLFSDTEIAYVRHYDVNTGSRIYRNYIIRSTQNIYHEAVTKSKVIIRDNQRTCMSM